MLIPADFLSGALLPWILSTPALPLAVMLFRRPAFTPLNVSLLLVCTATMLTNFYFNLLFKTPEQIDSQTYLLGVIVEFGLSMALLLNANGNRLLKGFIMGTAAMYIVALLAILLIAIEDVHMGMLLGIGYTLVFVFAVLVLHLTARENPGVFLTELPAFWIAAALILHYGLVALLLFTHPGSEPGEWMEDEGYAWVYTVVNLLRFILFSAAILSGISSEEEVRREAKA
jgi:hypothetical protein